MNLQILNSLISLLGNDLYISSYTEDTMNFIHDDKLYRVTYDGLVEEKVDYCLVSNDNTRYLTEKLKEKIRLL